MSDPRLCPKCETALPDGAAACPACGLAGARFDAYIDAPETGLAVSPELAALWQTVLERWDDPAVHDAFLRAAATAEAFAFAGRCYRRVARERAGDERAAAALERVRRMTEAAWIP